MLCWLARIPGYSQLCAVAGTTAKDTVMSMAIRICRKGAAPGAVLFACLLTAACAASGEGLTLRGHVTLSPSCAGAQPAEKDCRAPYADAKLDLLSASGAVVASARTAEDGSYAMTAPAGRYRLKVLVPGKLPRCPSPQLELGRQAPAVADINCDSGMR